MLADEIVITSQDGIILARVDCPAFEEQHSQALLQQLQAATKETPAVPVLLNLSKVEFMPSMAIGALVTLWKDFKDGGRRFILVGMQAPVRKTLTLCRLDKLFEYSENEEEAKRRLGPPAA